MSRIFRPLATVVAVVILAALVVWLLWPSPGDSGPGPRLNDSVQPGTSQMRDLIEEDDPRWDCHTMGNRICGPTQAPTPER